MAQWWPSPSPPASSLQRRSVRLVWRDPDQTEAGVTPLSGRHQRELRPDEPQRTTPSVQVIQRGWPVRSRAPMWLKRVSVDRLPRGLGSRRNHGVAGRQRDRRAGGRACRVRGVLDRIGLAPGRTDHPLDRRGGRSRARDCCLARDFRQVRDRCWTQDYYRTQVCCRARGWHRAGGCRCQVGWWTRGLGVAQWGWPSRGGTGRGGRGSW